MTDCATHAATHTESDHMTPLAVVLQLIGPVDIVAEVIGRTRGSVYNMMNDSKVRAQGDIMPPHARALLAYAAARKIPLTADDLIWGASRSEIADRLALAKLVQPLVSQAVVSQPAVSQPPATLAAAE